MELIMISDTLSHALDRIESYQSRYGDTYGSISGAIFKVTTVMKSLMTYLDVPPPRDIYPRYSAAHGRLLAEIEAVDVNGLLKALDDLRMSWPAPGPDSNASSESQEVLP
jgi:hypothetical protein